MAGLAIGVGIALMFTGIGGIAGAMILGATSGSLIEGGSAYLRGIRGKELARTSAKGAVFGAVSGGIGWGAGKAVEKGMGKLATKGFKVSKNPKIAIERHGIRPNKGQGFKRVPKVGHINIGKLHVIKPSTAKKLFGKRSRFIF